MFTVIKKMEISASHRLTLDHQSKCEALHGHNFQVTVYCHSKELNEDGMVVDFSEIKRKIHGFLDHRNLNEILPFNPTSENLAKWIHDQIDCCYRVEVQESSNNTAIYEDDRI